MKSMPKARRWQALVLAIVICLGAIGGAGSALAATSDLTSIGEGVKYGTLVKSLAEDKQAVLHYVIADPAQPWVEIKPVLAGGKLGELANLSGMAREFGAAAAVNGSFFSRNDNLIPLDTTVIDRQLYVKSEREATALIWGDDRKIKLDQVIPQVYVKLPAKKMIFTVSTFNRPCSQGIALYTPLFGSTTGTDENAVEYICQPGNGGLTEVTATAAGNAAIPAGGFVVSFQGEKKSNQEYFAIGDRVGWSVDYRGYEDVRHLLANGPLLVHQGCSVVPIPGEGLESALWNRNPRTAVGLTKEGKVLLLTVDGRNSHSVGCTFEELASWLIELGAQEAMALDGGGSTTMLVEGKVVNEPSDGTERRINNALLVISQMPVYLNGQRLYFEFSPVIRQGRVLVPGRQMFETMGAKVTWDEKKRAVLIAKGKTKVELPLDKKSAVVNGKTVKLEAEAQIINNRVVVPVRFLSQALGAKVSWDAQAQSVHVSY